MSVELYRAIDGALGASFEGVERVAAWATLGNGAGLALSVTTMAGILETAPERLTPVPALLFLVGALGGAVARLALSEVRSAVAGAALVEREVDKAHFARRRRRMVATFQFSLGLSVSTFVAACGLAVFAVS